MVNSLEIGERGEKLARGYLESIGYVYVDSNWKCKFGEIDLIMKSDNMLVFVEVKLRSSDKFGGGIESVDYTKKQKLLRAMKLYLLDISFEDNYRFDVIAIAVSMAEEVEITHIPYAIEE